MTVRLRGGPQLLLVDQMAHANREGSRHLRRCQDIEELLRAGIHVYTTVDVQNLESLEDLVFSVTKRPVKEKIPDSVFDGRTRWNLWIWSRRSCSGRRRRRQSPRDRRPLPRMS